MATTERDTIVTPLRGQDGAEPGPTYRTPPHNFEAEMALLGAILANNRAFERVSDFLRPEHFADDIHGRIFDAAGTLIERGQLANPVTLKNMFERDGDLAELGGAQYLAKLAGSVVNIINAADYGRTIHDLYLRRQLIAIGEDVVNTAHDHDLDHSAPEQIEEAEQRLFDLATTGDYEGGFQPFKAPMLTAIEMMERAHRRDSATVGVTAGFIDLDKLLGGLHPSDLLILAGRPSMGKSALAINIAHNIANAYQAEQAEDGTVNVKDGGVVAFFSLEMSADQLATRILSSASEVESDKILRGEMSDKDFERVVQASKQLSNMPLYIDDTAALTVSSLRTRARRLMRQQGLHLIIVDYLQLLSAAYGNQPENRVQEISGITRALKALAKELNVPVLALSQLSRAVEQREDKRPQLADLRESGSIEQDADVVMFIFREGYYLDREQPVRRIDEADDKFNARYERWAIRLNEVADTAEVNIGKQRHGPTGRVLMRYHGSTTRFHDFIGDDHLPEQNF